MAKFRAYNSTNDGHCMVCNAHRDVYVIDMDGIISRLCHEHWEELKKMIDGKRLAKHENIEKRLAKLEEDIDILSKALIQLLEGLKAEYSKNRNSKVKKHNAEFFDSLSEFLF